MQNIGTGITIEGRQNNNVEIGRFGNAKSQSVLESIRRKTH